MVFWWFEILVLVLVAFVLGAGVAALAVRFLLKSQAQVLEVESDSGPAKEGS